MVWLIFFSQVFSCFFYTQKRYSTFPWPLTAPQALPIPQSPLSGRVERGGSMTSVKSTPHPTTQLSVQPVSPHPVSEPDSMRPHREKRDRWIVWGLGLSAPLWRLTKSGTEVGQGGVRWGRRLLLPCLQPLNFFTQPFFNPQRESKGWRGIKKNCKHLRASHADRIKDDCLHRLYLVRHHVMYLIKTNSPDIVLKTSPVYWSANYNLVKKKAHCIKSPMP